MSGELGASLLQARRLPEAEKFLKWAYADASSSKRAESALDLGNLAAIRKDVVLARHYYDEAENLAAADLPTRLAAGLNRVKTHENTQKLSALVALSPRVALVAEPNRRARLYLNLGNQANELGEPGLETAFRSFDAAYKLLPELEVRLKLEALDALSGLYERKGRIREALNLSEYAVRVSGKDADGLNIEDLLVRLEWRKGRLFQLQGRNRDALRAYQSAAEHLEAIRQDIPVELESGRSSYQEILRPVFTGLVDLLLAAADELPERARAGAYLSAIHEIELTKQSEMQDYLGDRCSVETVRSVARTPLPVDTAVLYPILLPDRLELLLQTEKGVIRRTVNARGEDVASLALTLSRELPRYWSKEYLVSAQKLYDLVLRPLERDLLAQGIQTIVVVPDGPLRLIPMGALHDGQKFAIERFAVTTVTGMSMTNLQAPGRGGAIALLAGLSEPGPVLAKLASGIGAVSEAGPSSRVAPSLLAHDGPQIRSGALRIPQVGAGVATDPAARTAALKESLLLPGVKDEIRGIRAIIPNVSIFDEAFTLGRFGEEVQSGDYRILHIASHGVFGGNASSSYIMTYDDLLYMNDLESILKVNRSDGDSIELLTLSACETAEGNDRAPLGISGVAIKAKARSVLGTLWPVGDEAASKLMEGFYSRLASKNFMKAQALQSAQLDLLKNEALSHPFFWAPFVLIGNWM